MENVQIYHNMVEKCTGKELRTFGEIVNLNVDNFSLYLVKAAELQSICDTQVIFPSLAVISSWLLTRTLYKLYMYTLKQW